MPLCGYGSSGGCDAVAFGASGVTERSASYRDVFAVAEFRALWLAHVLSVGGDQLARVALTVLVFAKTSSPGWAALTYALTYLPDLVGGAALAGVADHYPRRAVMVTADVARAGVLVVMAVPGVPLVVQAGLLVVVQLLAAPFSAARQAVLPDVLTGDRLTVGLGLISMTYQLALVIGFGLGAAVVAGLGTSGALWADAGTFVVSAAVIRFGLREHAPQPAGAAAETGRWAAIVAGWALVARDARLRSLLAIACCSGFFVVPEGLAVPYAAQLGAGTAAAGWLLAANPIGTVLGMTVLTRIAPDRRRRWLGPLAITTSLVVLPTGFAPGVVLSVCLWALSGALSAHDMITQSSYVAAVPADQRGQVVGVAIAALRVAQGLGIVLAGMLAEVVTPSTVIAVAAALGVLFALFAARAWARAASPRPSSS
jgi:predicted MFS family arabinose efflux permease